MQCPVCQFENRDEAKFCGKCGHKFEVTCPECGKNNHAGNNFCDECGQNLILSPAYTPKELSFDEKITKIQKYLPKGLVEKILSQRDRIEGERKQVTVMFCDLEGFTQLSDKLGPEDAYTIMDQVYEILIHKVHDYEGTVNEMTGDGIMALFGAPIALEDAPQRAIRSAYAIHREMTRFSDKMKQEKEGISPLKMRIGIHTGPVVVGTLGNDLRVEFKAVGDTVNLASRIENIAESGATYVTDETFKLTEGFFRFEALGEKKIKGKEGTIKTYRVVAPGTRRTKFDVSAERGLTPFVGRDRELELLIDGFERVRTGHGQAFSIMAEAGVGKSRLLYEFRKAIANEDVTFLEGKCLSYSRGVAYHPIIDILKSNFDISENDGDIGIREKVLRGLKVLGVDEASTLPYLLELLSVKDSGIDRIPMSLEARRDRIMGTLRRIVLKGSEIKPLIMAFEDLHWVDKSSEDLLKDLLAGISGTNIFLIFTYRPEFVHTWAARSYHSQLTLNRLSNRESLLMVSHLLGIDDLDKNLEELILEKTEGVPFFIEEFVKSLKDLRIIKKKENRYHLIEDVQDLTIPATIQDVIMARVDSLPEGAKELLQIGSIIGREFVHKLIKKVTEIPDEELLPRLSILKDSELLYERGIYPDATYIFKHSLTQDAVFQSMLKGARQIYHRKIGEVLEQHFPETSEMKPEVLAHHLAEAGLAEKALTYYQRAGELSIRRSANIEAIDHLGKGLELLKTLPETPEHNQQELTLQITIGVALSAIKNWNTPEVERTYSRAWELCQKIGDTPQTFQVLCGLFYNKLERLEFHTCLKLAEELMELAQSQQEPTFISVAHGCLGDNLFWIGELTKAQYNLEQVISLHNPREQSKLAVLYWVDIGIHARCYLAFVLWLLGFPEQASQKSQEAMALGHNSSRYSLAFALDFDVWFHCFRRDIRKAQKRAERLIELSVEDRFAYWLADGTLMQGWALAMQGKGEPAISQICEGMATYRAMGCGLGRPFQLALLSGAYVNVGQPDKGLHMLDEAQALVNKTGERWWEAELYRLKGKLLLALCAENQSEAEACFQQALDVARHQQAKSLELRAAMSLSRLWQNQGKIKEARQLLDKIYGWFTEGFDMADLKEAKALLQEIS